MASSDVAGVRPEQGSGQDRPRPEAISHLVLNVRDLERAHAFYTEMLGFRQVGEIARLRMRFYAGVGGNHHDLALMQLVDAGAVPAPSKWRMTRPAQPGLNHIAIRMPSEAALMALFDLLKARGYPVEMRIDHGMSRSVYIADPDGNGLELMCDLPREQWEHDVNAALNQAQVLPVE